MRTWWEENATTDAIITIIDDAKFLQIDPTVTCSDCQPVKSVSSSVSGYLIAFKRIKELY